MGVCVSLVETAIEDHRLKLCTASNTPNFVPEVRRAKVVSVYDGDTITVAARHRRRGPAYLFKVRLAGIDAPEMRGGSDLEKQAAIAARDWLRQMIEGRAVTLEKVTTEKYGRLLATVMHRGRNVCHALVEQGHAVSYDGGAKQKFENRP
jgi:micrococcal nuclease